MDSTTITSKNTVGGSLYLVLSLCGLLTHIIVAIVFVKKWITVRTVSFHLISVQIMICDIGSLLIQLIVAVPVTYTGRADKDNFFLYVAPLYLDTIFYQGYLNFNFILTANRFYTFVVPSAWKSALPPRFTSWAILVTWIYFTSIVVAQNLSGCFKYFSATGFFISFDCSAVHPVGFFLKEYNRYASYVLPILMFLMYFIIYGVIRFANKNLNDMLSDAHKMRRKRQEQRLLLQSFIVCSVLELETVTFSLRRVYAFDPDTAIWINIAQSVFAIFNKSLSAIVYLIFNEEIRRGALTLLHCSNGKTMPRRETMQVTTTVAG